MYAVVSGEYEYIGELESFGIIPLPTLQNTALDRPVAYHADMNCQMIGDTVYLAQCQTDIYNKLKISGVDVKYINEPIASPYPNDVKLNIALCGKTAVCNTKTVSKTILDKLKTDGYKIYGVKQGYAGCSTLFVNEKAVITADDGIANALKNDIEVLNVSDSDISLCGYNNGFMGGCAKLINADTMLFFGDISKHRDYPKIREFLSRYNVHINCLSGKLTDIGSMILI